MKSSRSGAALLITLLLIGLLAVCLTAYFLAASGSRKRSVADREHSRARLYTDLAAQEAIAKIVSGLSEVVGSSSSDLRGSVTASPGLMEIRYFDSPPNRGTELGAAAFQNNPARPPFFRNPFFETYSGKPANPRWIPLFSWKWFAPALPNLRVSMGTPSEANPDYNPAAVFDINTTRNPFHPGHHNLTGVPASPIAPRYDRDGPSAFRPGEAASDRAVYVQWLPILSDPAEKPGEDNPMLGRYAYWVDVENTKVHLPTSTRPLRQSEFFGRLTGEPDADSGPGALEQSDENRYRAAQRTIESTLPRKGVLTADGQPGQGSNFAARAMRDLMLGWYGGEKPFVADNSLVDWDYFNGLRPAANKRGENIAFDDLLGELARHVSATPNMALNSWDEVFSLLDPAAQESDPARARLMRDSLRRTLGASTTIYGYEEERDPLGRAKLDFVKFQLEARRFVGAGGSPAGLKTTDLWRRLADAKYHRAYYPAAYPSGGAARSFISAFNRFSGNGNASDTANGEIAVQQLLLNVAEATLPENTPPYIDPNSGLVAMRSVPYVAEVATRARSALWLLPESAWTAPAGTEFNGKPLKYYLEHVIVDVAVACVNPDPFSNRFFDGTLKLDFSWHNPPTGAQVVQGPLTAPLRGRFTALPLPGDKAGKIRVDGETVYFRLGVIPGTALTNKDYAQTLRIRGWEIRDGNGALWHQVPIRHPRAASAPQWWQMAEQGANAGSGSGIDKHSLAAFQENRDEYGYRAVGWFSMGATDLPLLERIFLRPDEATSPERIADLQKSARKSSFVERVFSRDPALGHRTGNRALAGMSGLDSSHQKGHFYGMLGHTWRRIARQPQGSLGDEDEDPQDDGDGDDETQLLTLATAEYTSSGNQTLRARAKIPRGATYSDGFATATIPKELGVHSKNHEAKIWKQKASSLTAFFFDPQWEKCPLWEINGALSGDDSKDPLKDADVETGAKLETWDGVKTKESRLGVRGFFAGAPRCDLMTSMGELGFCHSGLPNFPIVLTDAVGWNEYLLNSPRNGPPMRMLLDLFTPGAFTDADTGESMSESAWRLGRYTSNSPRQPRRGTWNMNTSIAHDGYMAIREGDTGSEELKKGIDPTRFAARVAWIPSAAGYHRTEGGAEFYRGKKLEDLGKKPVIGLPLDRYSGPSPVMNRATGAWVALLGGDFTPGRVSGGTRWGFNNSGTMFFGPAQFTWNPGTGAVPYGSNVPFANFAVEGDANATGETRLITFGSDGRKEGGDEKGEGNINTGYLRGRFAADQGIRAAQINAQVSLPLAAATRFSLVPMRHFVSDLATEFQFGATFNDIKTPLNPRQSAFAPTTELKRSDGNGFPGSHHSSGIFANAPVALLANQVSTSANVFTIHVVAQSIKDNGKVRKGIKNSGPGHSDPDDEVLAERWARVTIAKLPPQTATDAPPRFQILATDYRNASE